MNSSCSSPSPKREGKNLRSDDAPAGKLVGTPLVRILTAVPGFVLIFALIFLSHPPYILLNPLKILLQEGGEHLQILGKDITADVCLCRMDEIKSVMNTESLTLRESFPELRILIIKDGECSPATRLPSHPRPGARRIRSPRASAA